MALGWSPAGLKGASTRKREGIGTPNSKANGRSSATRAGELASCNALRKQDQKQKEARMKDQVRGKAEEIKGKATGDKGEELKGKMRQAFGNVKRTARDVRDDVKDEAERRRER